MKGRPLEFVNAYAERFVLSIKSECLNTRDATNAARREWLRRRIECRSGTSIAIFMTARSCALPDANDGGVCVDRVFRQHDGKQWLVCPHIRPSSIQSSRFGGQSAIV
jgi:hypothetical protein